MNTESDSYERRFGGLGRLYPNATQLAHLHVMIIGIGGVGSWSVETLARSGIGTLTLCDLDHVAVSNINRQIHATTHTIGMAKTQAMAERIHTINPDCTVHCFDDFIDPHNIDSVILHYQPHSIIDACDQHHAKLATILTAKKHHIPLITCGSAGGKTNTLALQCGDLSESQYDPLLSRLRHTLRRHHHFPALPKKMRVPVLWVNEAIKKPQQDCALQGLSCAGYGSTMAVTAPMGIAAAQWVIQTHLNANKQSDG